MPSAAYMGNLKTRQGKSAIVMAAIHSGHKIRPELLPYLKLSEEERLREEDPFTNEWIKISDNQIRVLPSRFEVDINRPREKAIYLNPNDAWGLDVWSDKLPEEVVARSLQVYDETYSSLGAYFDELLTVNDYLIVYDIHSYNHRRAGTDKFAPVEENPEINLGTANLNRELWAHVVDALIQEIRSYNFEGRHLSVGENVKGKRWKMRQVLIKITGRKPMTITLQQDPIGVTLWGLIPVLFRTKFICYNSFFTCR